MGFSDNFKKLYLNTVFYALVIVYSLLSIPVATVIIAVWAQFLPRRQAMKRFRQAIRIYGYIIIYGLAWPFIKVRFQDSGRKDNPHGPFIYVCNHRAASDPFLMATLPHEMIQVVNIWPFRIPLIGLIAKGAGYLSVREMPFKKFQAKATEALNNGVSIAVFPEGTRSQCQEMGNFHSAIFRVALQAGYDIVPVCISGNENIPTRKFVLHPGTITVRKLPAISWQNFQGQKPYVLKNRIRGLIAKELARMEQDTA